MRPCLDAAGPCPGVAAVARPSADRLDVGHVVLVGRRSGLGYPVPPALARTRPGVLDHGPAQHLGHPAVDRAHPLHLRRRDARGAARRADGRDRTRLLPHLQDSDRHFHAWGVRPAHAARTRRRRAASRPPGASRWAPAQPLATPRTAAAARLLATVPNALHAARQICVSFTIPSTRVSKPVSSQRGSCAALAGSPVQRYSFTNIQGYVPEVWAPLSGFVVNPAGLTAHSQTQLDAAL